MTLDPTRFTACHRHPSQPVTGFCALCLRERLSGLDPDTSADLPELRRCKTFSGNSREGHVRHFEPHRRSCDVITTVNKSSSTSNNSLLNLFNNEGGNNLGFEEINKDFEEDDGQGGVELKTMKEFIDLECRDKKQSGKDFISMAKKKLGNWRQKWTAKRPCDVKLVEKDVRINAELRDDVLRETQSEIGDYGFGCRRSCDTDPRFSIDGGPRYSFDDPRISLDGYMMGRASLPRIIAPLFSVDEDVVDRLSVVGGREKSPPGGCDQTRDYYTDPMNRRRRSFDQLGFYKKTDFDEMKSISNAKVSPTPGELFHGAKVLITNERHFNRNSTKDESGDVCIGDDGKGLSKKNVGWRKTWSVWNLLHKRSMESKDVGREVIGSSSSVSSTSSCKVGGLVQSRRTHNADKKCHGDRNRSVRYSPNNIDHGLLRFYLTPLRSTRSRQGKSRLKNSPTVLGIF